MAKPPRPEDLTHIHPGLHQFAVRIDDLTLDPQNARLHDDRNLKAISDSLEEHGQVIPIIVQKEGKIVRAGNGRCLALKAQGKKYVAALMVEHDDVEAVKFALRDNRTSELAAWDFEALSGHMRDLQSQGIDLHMLGWDDKEFGPLIAANWQPPEAGSLEDKASKGEGDKRKMPTFAVTEDQAIIVRGAIAKVRERENDNEITDGRALELICADWMQDPNWDPKV